MTTRTAVYGSVGFDVEFDDDARKRPSPTAHVTTANGLGGVDVCGVGLVSRWRVPAAPATSTLFTTCRWRQPRSRKRGPLSRPRASITALGEAVRALPFGQGARRQQDFVLGGTIFWGPDDYNAARRQRLRPRPRCEQDEALLRHELQRQLLRPEGGLLEDHVPAPRLRRAHEEARQGDENTSPSAAWRATSGVSRRARPAICTITHPGHSRLRLAWADPPVQQRRRSSSDTNMSLVSCPPPPDYVPGRRVPGGSKLMLSSQTSSASALLRRALPCSAVMGLLVTGTTSCASTPDHKRFTEIPQPDYPTYRDVGRYLPPAPLRGTLDCHGQPGACVPHLRLRGLPPLQRGRRPRVRPAADDGGRGPRQLSGGRRRSSRKR